MQWKPTPGVDLVLGDLQPHLVEGLEQLPLAKVAARCLALVELAQALVELERGALGDGVGGDDVARREHPQP
jgi:hypothetical protein